MALSSARSTTFFRSGGILLHPTSLPGRHGIGDLGDGARAFVDWLASARLSRWQVLPLVPPGPGGSPYSSPSAFAKNAALIDLDALVARGLLSAADVEPPAAPFALDSVDFAHVLPWKLERVDRAARALLDDTQGRAQVDAYARAHAWVLDYALYVAQKERADSSPWWSWEGALARHEPAAVDRAKAELMPRILRVVAQQMLVDEQWSALRAYARERGVSTIGDIPIYVDLDSSDVWANREMFLLDEAHRPLGVSGVPPDAFSDTGQLWGNPLFDWKRLKHDGYAWWIARMKRVLSSCDIVRVDHFRAFAAYWAVPHGDKDARGGVWVKGPGRSIFDALAGALGDLPIIAEDLGVITPDVEELRDSVGLPGMKVLQFAWGQGPDAAYLPHNHVPDCIVYTGTHDNDTSLGFWHKADQATRDQIRRYYAIDGSDFVWDFIRSAFSSVAHTAIVPMQDVLCLDSGARMNMPSQGAGNWHWRVRVEAFHASLAARLRDLAELYGRAR